MRRILLYFVKFCTKILTKQKLLKFPGISDRELDYPIPRNSRSRIPDGLADLPRRRLADIFLRVATVAYIPNFNFLARLVVETWRGSQNKKVGLLISLDAP